MKKRLFSIVLTLCMVLMLVPATAFADEHVYRVAGQSGLCGSDWNATDDNNRMTYNEETGRFEKVYTDVAANPIKGYEYKIVVDGATWIPDGSGPNPTVYVKEDNATVTIWYDENTAEWGADVAYDMPALTLTIDGPDVVCSWQDYEFTVTPPAGVTLDKEFGYDTGMKGGGADLTVDADGVGHGTVVTEWYDLNKGSFTLNAQGTTADGTSVTGTKTVQVSPEHIFVDGVCGCGVKEQYIVTYDPGEYGTGSIEAGVKTYDKPFTLSSETFKREGYVQTGWRDANYWMYFALGDTYYADEDVTLYPIWDEVITLTVPYTTTVKLGDVGVPGETTFNLQVLGSDGDKLSSVEVEVETTPVKTNGEGDYYGTLKIKGTSEDIANMLRKKVFVKQAEGDYPNWEVDDTVWGLAWNEGIVAMAADDAVADNSVLIFPAEYVKTEDGGYYDMVENKDAVDKMKFTNTYTKSEDSPAEPDGTTNGDSDNDSKTDAEDSAKTGDDTNLALWLALMLLAGAGITGTTIYTRRKRTNE